MFRRGFQQAYAVQAGVAVLRGRDAHGSIVFLLFLQGGELLFQAGLAAAEFQHCPSVLQQQAGGFLRTGLAYDLSAGRVRGSRSDARDLQGC